MRLLIGSLVSWSFSADGAVRSSGSQPPQFAARHDLHAPADMRAAFGPQQGTSGEESLPFHFIFLPGLTEKELPSDVLNLDTVDAAPFPADMRKNGVASTRDDVDPFNQRLEQLWDAVQDQDDLKKATESFQTEAGQLRSIAERIQKLEQVVGAGRFHDSREDSEDNSSKESVLEEWFDAREVLEDPVASPDGFPQLREDLRRVRHQLQGYAALDEAKTFSREILVREAVKLEQIVGVLDAQFGTGRSQDAGGLGGGNLRSPGFLAASKAGPKTVSASGLLGASYRPWQMDTVSARQRIGEITRFIAECFEKNKFVSVPNASESSFAILDHQVQHCRENFKHKLHNHFVPALQTRPEQEYVALSGTIQFEAAEEYIREGYRKIHSQKARQQLDQWFQQIVVPLIPGLLETASVAEVLTTKIIPLLYLQFMSSDYPNKLDGYHVEAAERERALQQLRDGLKKTLQSLESDTCPDKRPDEATAQRRMQELTAKFINSNEVFQKFVAERFNAAFLMTLRAACKWCNGVTVDVTKKMAEQGLTDLKYVSWLYAETQRGERRLHQQFNVIQELYDDFARMEQGLADLDIEKEFQKSTDRYKERLKAWAGRDAEAVRLIESARSLDDLTALVRDGKIVSGNMRAVHHLESAASQLQTAIVQLKEDIQTEHHFAVKANEHAANLCSEIKQWRENVIEHYRKQNEEVEKALKWAPLQIVLGLTVGIVGGLLSGGVLVIPGIAAAFSVAIGGAGVAFGITGCLNAGEPMDKWLQSTAIAAVAGAVSLGAYSAVSGAVAGIAVGSAGATLGSML